MTGAVGISAEVVGTFHRPMIRVALARGAIVRDGTPGLAWVKGLPDRRWDPERFCWWVTGLGPDPADVLRRAGIRPDISRSPARRHDPGDPSPSNVAAVLAELATPVIRRHPDDPARVAIRPRLAGATHVSTVLVPMADTDEATGRLSADLIDLVEPDTGRVRAGLNLDGDLAAAALDAYAERVQAPRAARDRRLVRAARAAALGPPGTAVSVAPAAAAVVAAGDTSDGAGSALDVLTAATGGGVPDWFGLDLYEYQVSGALALLAGRSLCADEAGCGKTRQALAAAAAVLDRERCHPAPVPDGAGSGPSSGRVLIVVPPVVLTHWARETVAAHLGRPDPSGRASWWPTGLAPAPGSPAADGAVCAVVQPGRRMPALPDRGVLIVADSTLASRPALADQIVSWSPGVVIYDEAHRARTWTSTRSRTMRSLIGRLSVARTAGVGAAWGEGTAAGLCPLPALTVLPLTGTPMFTGSPVELIPLLAMTGQLDWVFGGRAAFAQRFCRRDHFGRWVGRARNLEELRRLLDAHVWVRRHKADILPWLPEKRWVTAYVDVPTADIRAARAELERAVGVWLDDQPAGPDGDDIEQWCRGQIGLLSPLRRATGLAKVPAAVEQIETRLAQCPPRPGPDGWLFDQPLVLWAHHRDVITALAGHAGKLLRVWVGTTDPPVGVIDGSTGLDERTRLVDQLQAHRLGVLVCQITAAGVGLTLTACAEPLFVESDWTAQLMSQAEDRHHRPGQTRGVTLTALCATGTLDEHVIKVRNAKDDLTAKVVGDRRGRATRDDTFDGSDAPAPWQLLAGIVADVAARRRPGRARHCA
ncbi:DEAD/DEAH box helicase [Microlunatus ginsengisoli]|uniref:Helicase ATP-binding domain-containing protein n=1 Tax=Microlunatus ginsengisoli TaxID=363863 RepID=A0ABP7ALG4_9ACTN